MKKKIFWIVYIIFVAVLVVLGALVLAEVNDALAEYEEAQPEKVVEVQIQKIKEAAANNTLEEIITFYEPEQAAYDTDILAYTEYKEKLKNAKKLTYKIKTGYSEKEQQFNILADDEVVAVLTLESIREEIKLAILTISEWQVKTITPVVTLTNYDYTVEVPKGFRVTINGTELSNPQEAETAGWELYTVETLYNEPEIKVYDAYGNEALYNIVNNHVTPVVHSFSLKLPKGFSVLVGGKAQEGTPEGEEVRYSITTLYEVLELTDAYGNCIEYRGGDSVYTYDYQIKIPDNFQISVGGTDGAVYKTSTEENTRYRYVKEYADMPGIATYELKNALCEPEVVIYDNINQKVDCVFENYIFEHTEQTGMDAMPEELAAKVDVLAIAKMWSKLMSEDLEGSNKGFDTMKQYLITDSYLYKDAYKWVTDVDITYTADHVLENPPFTEERVTNYISYGENLFSCDIYFVKHMYIPSKDKKRTDTMNSTFFFMYYDETEDGKDNPRWVILDKRDILSE